jgi:hypothetical protein
MSLLLNSSIEQKLNNNLRGHLARIGGKVDQVFGYKNCTVEDINIENRVSNKFGRSFIGRLRYGYDLLEQEIRFWRKGYHAVRDRKTCFFDVHQAISQKKLPACFDGILSSNVIEHSHNPIWFLLNMQFLVKQDGYHFHAIPCYRFTFDQYRQPTTLQHLIEDFTTMTTPENCQIHADEHHHSALKWDKVLGDKKPSYPGIHCHVFDEHNTKALFEMIFQDVTVDIIQNEKYGDVLVTCRNALNPEFKAKFGKAMGKYGISDV